MKILLTIALLFSLSAFAQEESKPIVRISMQQLTKEHCEVAASNIQAVSLIFVKSLFMKDCVGKAVSILQQIEQSETPNYYNYAVVTTNDFGNVPYAAKHPDIFFGYGQFNFEQIVADAERKVCPQMFKALREDEAELIIKYAVNELVVYDVRISYKEMGIVSVRYFLNGDRQAPDYYPVRHDFNFICEE